MMFGMMEFTVGKIQVTYYKIGCVCFFGADCRIVCTLYIFVSSTLTSPTRPSPTLMGPSRLCSCGAGVTTDYLPRLPSTPLGKPLYRLGGLALPCHLTSHPSQGGSPASAIRCQAAPLSFDCSLPKVPRPHPWDSSLNILFSAVDFSDSSK